MKMIPLVYKTLGTTLKLHKLCLNFLSLARLHHLIFKIKDLVYIHSAREKVFPMLCTHSLSRQKKRRVVKPHPLKGEGRGCVLSVIQAGFPLGEKTRRGGWAGERKEIQEERKIKQRVRDSQGRERIKVNMCLFVSMRGNDWTLVECWGWSWFCITNGRWEWMTVDEWRRQETEGWWLMLCVCEVVCLM